MRRFLYSLILALLAAGTAAAADCCAAPAACDPGDPGCGPACQQQCSYNCKECPKCGGKLACKVVCETKEVKKHVWVVKCEPFCLPLPGCGRDCGCGDPGCGGDCGAVACDDRSCGKCKNCCDPCAAENAKKIVPPKCGIVRCKKTLEKKEVTCTVPSYKCVPYCPCCEGCGNGCAAPAGGEKVEGGGATTFLPQAPMPQVIGTSYRK